VLREFLEKSGELGQRHTYVEWETICLKISSMINGLPMCYNSDDRGDALNELGLITPNMFLLGRNNSRSPSGFVTMEFNPAKALKELTETNHKLVELLGDFVPRFIPGKKFSDLNPPEIGDVVLFVSKENMRSRNVQYKYGRITATFVDGRINKCTVEYRNSDEVVIRSVDRTVDNLVLIVGSNEVDFNSYEHQLASWIQQKYL
jgi:hypothetical protein